MTAPNAVPLARSHNAIPDISEYIAFSEMHERDNQHDIAAICDEEMGFLGIIQPEEGKKVAADQMIDAALKSIEDNFDASDPVNGMWAVVDELNQLALSYATPVKITLSKTFVDASGKLSVVTAVNGGGLVSMNPGNPLRDKTEPVSGMAPLDSKLDGSRAAVDQVKVYMRQLEAGDRLFALSPALGAAYENNKQDTAAFVDVEEIEDLDEAAEHLLGTEHGERDLIVIGQKINATTVANGKAQAAGKINSRRSLSQWWANRRESRKDKTTTYQKIGRSLLVGMAIQSNKGKEKYYKKHNAKDKYAELRQKNDETALRTAVERDRQNNKGIKRMALLGGVILLSAYLKAKGADIFPTSWDDDAIDVTPGNGETDYQSVPGNEIDDGPWYTGSVLDDDPAAPEGFQDEDGKENEEPTGKEFDINSLFDEVEKYANGIAENIKEEQSKEGKGGWNAVFKVNEGDSYSSLLQEYATMNMGLEGFDAVDAWEAHIEMMQHNPEGDYLNLLIENPDDPSKLQDYEGCDSYKIYDGNEYNYGISAPMSAQWENEEMIRRAIKAAAEEDDKID